MTQTKHHLHARQNAVGMPDMKQRQAWLDSNRDQDVRNTVANKLKYLRKAVGVTQSEIGAFMGDISFQQVQKYENGSNLVPLDRLSMLAKKFDLSIEFFVDAENYNIADFVKQTDEERVLPFYSNTTLELAEMISGLPEEKRKALRVLCEMK
ncbi:helix-turn-helix domain-containing protein [Bartonella sp. LJL80]